jgi:hypothetical protein
MSDEPWSHVLITVCCCSRGGCRRANGSGATGAPWPRATSPWASCSSKRSRSPGARWRQLATKVPRAPARGRLPEVGAEFRTRAAQCASTVSATSARAAFSANRARSPCTALKRVTSWWGCQHCCEDTPQEQTERGARPHRTLRATRSCATFCRS